LCNYDLKNIENEKEKENKKEYEDYSMNITSNKLISLAKLLYRGRDVSHGIEHVMKVRENSLKLAEKLNVKESIELIKIETAALFHDLWDSKYIKNDKEYVTIRNNFRRELSAIYFSIHDITEIEIIIDNISLSKEIRRKNSKHKNKIIDNIKFVNENNKEKEKDLERVSEKEIKEREIPELKHLQLLRDIVSDADKIEMLGNEGIKRIVDYEIFNRPQKTSKELEEVVLEVYDKKISKLLSENYIRTKPGREIAEPLMKETELLISKLRPAR